MINKYYLGEVITNASEDGMIIIQENLDRVSEVQENYCELKRSLMPVTPPRYEIR